MYGTKFTSQICHPRTKPYTEEELARQKSHVNYAFFIGATNDNVGIMDSVDWHHVPGIKLFMGSSTGNMLVDKYGSLLKIFQKAAELNVPLMSHCEDTDIINRNMEQMTKALLERLSVQLMCCIR